MNKVNVWEETISIPTYLVDAPDKNPLFFETRVYQGSSGKVYPHPITEKISDEKIDVDYQGVWLENDYLKVLVLPELGGRIQRAIDKTNNYDFVYYNQVIKPALVGLTGPWISGGIEFNWPQHHRPSTFMPTQHTIVENEDGSSTVWVSEIDKMYGTKGMAGFTLYPDKAYIEIEGRLYNRTDMPQTFLWWANPAVPANDFTYSVFPPDVNAVMDHGKRAVSTFPIATGEYYKYDYSEGIDISRYKNIKVPTSYMAYHSNYDFIGNYDENLEAGLLHVASHHISPGKKQWVWGNSDFGIAWDRNLTDEDGPYVELMTGVYTDNQPDFTWLKPYEAKEFKQYFMPYKGVGMVNNATIDASISIRENKTKTLIRIYTTAIYTNACVQVKQAGKIVEEIRFDASPLAFVELNLDLDFASINNKTSFVVKSEEGKTLVEYNFVERTIEEVPNPAESLPEPSTIKTNEELFLAATHIEQHRHATLKADDYYLEGLKRDAGDIRLNNGYGLSLMRRGLVEEAKAHFETAIFRQKWKSPNPYYGEPLYNLGKAQLFLEEYKDAYASFYKATWNEDVQASAFFEIAVLDYRNKDFDLAKQHVERALIKNAHNMKARHLKALIIKEEGKSLESFIEESLKIDPIDFASLYLKLGATKTFTNLVGNDPHNYIEQAVDYINLGDYETAIKLLELCPNPNAMITYTVAYCHHLMGNEESALDAIIKAECQTSDYVFPNRLIEIKILEYAIASGKCIKAQYYLGNLFYDKKRYEEAIALWEESSSLNPHFATPHRNLSFAYYNLYDDEALAYKEMLRALECDPSDGRILMETDILSSRLAHSIESRIERLEANPETLKERDDLYVTYLTMLNQVGRYQDVLDLMSQRQFHAWEGGEGNVSKQYQYALTELALQSNKETALKLLEETKSYPVYLGEGKLPNDYDNIALYYQGILTQDKDLLKRATVGLDKPEIVKYYHDQPADTILYQGLAFEALGDQVAANRLYNMLVSFGERHIFDKVEHDYFAVSLPETVVFKDDMQANHELYCKYVIGLGELGKKDYSKAMEIFNEILAIRPDYIGAQRHKNFIIRMTSSSNTI